MAEAKTITEHKAAFIRTQVRLLSTPLHPSPAWRTLTTTQAPSIPDEPEPSISEKVVDEILNKLNGKVKQHSRNVFALQSQRHVAEQIDTLYWNEVSAENTLADADTTWVKKNIDFSETEVIQELPERYHDLHFHSDHQASDADVGRYRELRSRLEDLAKERDQKRKRLESYRALQELLRPFENARENIQPNLVTKDGELSRELDRMKVLIARVTARMSQTTTTDVIDMDNAAQDNGDKLAHVLELG